MNNASNKVLAALHSLMSEIGAIGKTNTNSFQNYKFRSVAQAMSALQPLLIKHNLIIQPFYDTIQLHEQEKGYTATCVLNLTFHHVEDGSTLSYRIPGQGADSGDKALGKAMAMAFKYAVFQGMAVPEDGVDSEFSEPEVKTKPKTAAPSMKNLLG